MSAARELGFDLSQRVSITRLQFVAERQTGCAPSRAFSRSTTQPGAMSLRPRKSLVELELREASPLNSQISKISPKL
jgi:hypothetical protein